MALNLSTINSARKHQIKIKIKQRTQRINTESLMGACPTNPLPYDLALKQFVQNVHVVHL
jgi:hypothetical protein